GLVPFSPPALVKSNAMRLWDVSLELTGTSCPL
ncbi:MAG: hypothetical protein JWL70_2585, partial [Acidimicrobiia bacterium]|nr:hypothetical protein [Acidimicrobiia bacterium]